MREIVLASASPRRREILELAGVPFTVCAAADEQIPAVQDPAAYALAAAKAKCEAVFSQHPDRVVLGADTVVAVDDTILGKPKTADEAVEMLLKLGGRTHRVLTGVFVCAPDRQDGFVDEAIVEFYPISREQAVWYVATGEPMDKAGAYGIQGYGMRFVRGIHGDFYTVMGLPGAKVLRFLEGF